MINKNMIKIYTTLLNAGYETLEIKQDLKDLLIYLYINKQVTLDDMFSYEDKYRLNLFF